MDKSQEEVDKSQEEVDMRQEFMDMGQEEVSREQKVAAIWQKELRLLEREVARARRALAPSTYQPYKLAGGQPVRLVPLELLRSGNQYHGWPGRESWLWYPLLSLLY